LANFNISIGIPYTNLQEKLNKENFKGIYNVNKFNDLDAYKKYEGKAKILLFIHNTNKFNSSI
jgi:hypothetical protein